PPAPILGCRPRRGRGPGSSPRSTRRGDAALWPFGVARRRLAPRADVHSLAGILLVLLGLAASGSGRSCGRCGERVHRATAADPSTRSPCAWRDTLAGAEPDPTSRRRLVDRRWRIV